MFFRGKFYPEKLIICEHYSDEYDISAVWFACINSITFDNGRFPVVYPARIKTTFIDSVNEGDIDDVILNTIGGMLGYACFIIGKGRKKL